MSNKTLNCLSIIYYKYNISVVVLKLGRMFLATNFCLFKSSDLIYNLPMDFHGVKIAILVEDKLLMFLRDNKPGLFNANKWDFFGGGRENEETPQECAIREIREEIEIDISPEFFIWEKFYPAQKDPTQKAVFMVAKIPKEYLDKINLKEGQKWTLFEQKTFFEKDDVIEALKDRFSDYVNSQESV